MRGGQLITLLSRLWFLTWFGYLVIVDAALLFGRQGSRDAEMVRSLALSAVIIAVGLGVPFLIRWLDAGLRAKYQRRARLRDRTGKAAK
jgi:hypothetical protein